MNFRKYQHVVKLSDPEAEGLLLGTVFVFPKIDGTNGSVWLGDDGEIKAGSRNRELSLENDNQGFYQHILSNKEPFVKFFNDYPNYTLFGEFLIPHTLKTYKENAWRHFYVFDIMDGNGQYVPYGAHMTQVVNFLNNARYGFRWIPATYVLENPDIDSIHHCLQQNTYLIQDNQGIGEGIVIKNYDFCNKYDRIQWAKMVTNDFKEKHCKETGPIKMASKISLEQDFIDKKLTNSMIDKVHANITNSIDNRGEYFIWNSKLIPRLLETVYHDLVNEETYNFLKTIKGDKTIDFNRLRQLCYQRIKEYKSDLF
jgi:hypothetical protein